MAEDLPKKGAWFYCPFSEPKRAETIVVEIATNADQCELGRRPVNRPGARWL